MTSAFSAINKPGQFGTPVGGGGDDPKKPNHSKPGKHYYAKKVLVAEKQKKRQRRRDKSAAKGPASIAATEGASSHIPIQLPVPRVVIPMQARRSKLSDLLRDCC